MWNIKTLPLHIILYFQPSEPDACPVEKRFLPPLTSYSPLDLLSCFSSVCSSNPVQQYKQKRIAKGNKKKSMVWYQHPGIPWDWPSVLHLTNWVTFRINRKRTAFSVCHFQANVMPQDRGISLNTHTSSPDKDVDNERMGHQFMTVCSNWSHFWTPSKNLSKHLITPGISVKWWWLQRHWDDTMHESMCYAYSTAAMARPRIFCINRKVTVCFCNWPCIMTVMSKIKTSYLGSGLYLLVDNRVLKLRKDFYHFSVPHLKVNGFYDSLRLD